MSGGARALDVVPGLAVLAQEQALACSRRQLTALGVDDQDVAHQVGAQRWQLVGPLVVVLHTGALSLETRRWTSLLTAGPRSALCAWSALDLWGLRGWERPGDHVVVPRSSTPPRLPWMVLHESRRHRPDDVRTRSGLRVHALERAAVDAAAWAPTPRAACGLLAAVVQQRLSTADRLAAVLGSAGRVQHGAVLRATLGDIAGGSQSMAEIDLVRLCRRAGLPVPTRQGRRRDALGRWRYLDAEWRLPSGRRVLLEVDGVLHVAVAHWYDDALRTAEVARPGETLLRLPAMAVRCDQERVTAILRRHLS